MVIQLQKGQRINLKKESGQTLTKISVGLGWDPLEANSSSVKSGKSGGLFSLFKTKNEAPEKSVYTGNYDFDLDASVIVRNAENKTEEIVYYANTKNSNGSISHSGDNLTGQGDGDDEVILVDLQNVPDHAQKLVFIVNIYQGKSRKQHFGHIENAYIRIYDTKTNEEFARYELNEDYSSMLAMFAGEIYRHDGEWKFKAIGQATKDNSINEMDKNYR